MRASDAAGLYVHIPFCLTRCGYCDFNTYAGLEELQSPYMEALLREARLAAGEWANVAFRSIFVGGGTPTTLPASTLTDLLGSLRELFSIETDAEITIEANPDTVDESYLRRVLAGGVTRLSMGVQSFDPAVLRSLDRVHSAESARAAFGAAGAAGFTNVNLDLIYGAEGETLDSWTRTLAEAIALGPEHLSCYSLTVEPNTLLGRKVAAGITPAPDGDLQADMYDVACGLLSEAGFAHYEVSNWARPGFESVHNKGYWEGWPYLGLGAGAHSYWDGRRWWNVRPPSEYISMASGGRLPVGGEERLSEEDRRLEVLLLGLRTSAGIDGDPLVGERMAPYVAEGLAVRRNGRIALTDRGMLLANEMALALAD
jgi:putative oxygen-independent coproporphyrinogen III oxidase